MSAKPPTPKVDPFASLKKGWAKARPVRVVLAWAFTVHGSIRLGTDFFNLRQPFILSDVLGWWAWFQDRWTDVRDWWSAVRGES